MSFATRSAGTSLVLASMLNVAHTVGYPVLFLAVMAESGGAPVPGETALITGAVLASQGKLEIWLVILLAACAAIVGDNIGYLIGRKGGRWLLQRPGRFQRQRLQVLDTGEPFFAKHGPKAVFFGRFILGLRVWASWLAGATKMPWRSFLFWNACGGIIWATTVGVIAYELGRTAENLTEAFGFFGLAAVLVVIAGVLFLHYSHRRRSAAVGREQRQAREAVQGDPLGGYRAGADGREVEVIPATTNESRPLGRLRCDDRSDMARSGSTSP